MSRHNDTSPRWHGNPRVYQDEARARLSNEMDRTLLPWTYIQTSCEVPMCLVTACMTATTPRKAGYVPGVCTYCGDPAGSRDHLLPKPVTGPALRSLVLTVPSCGWCNSVINDEPTWNVQRRRERAQRKLYKNNRAKLKRGLILQPEIAELGYVLRESAQHWNSQLLAVRARLSWPRDPFYDMRAFQVVGIDDPETAGLCDDVAHGLFPEYADDVEEAA